MKDTFFIVSAELAGNSRQENAYCTRELKDDLYERAVKSCTVLAFKQVQRSTCKPFPFVSQAFIVICDRELALEFARRYDQESIILVNSERIASEIYLDKVDASDRCLQARLGQFKSTSIEIAQTGDGYIQDYEFANFYHITAEDRNRADICESFNYSNRD